MRRLLPNLFIGPSVHPLDLPRLCGAGITAVLSLQQPGTDLSPAAIERMRAACARHAIGFDNIGVHDYDPEAIIAALPTVLARLSTLIDNAHVVYLHCTEGINRAPSVALAYLVHHRQQSVDKAVAEVARCDPGARPYAPLIAWLRATWG